MRNRLKIGIPLGAGLATGGYALSQGEDPGSAALAGVGGALGGAAGLLGARRLAGKYSPEIRSRIEDAATRPGIPTFLQEVLEEPLQLSPKELERRLGKGTASLAVPAAAGLAGLGGVALGAIPGSMGVPGFTDQRIDPESYGSSNSPGARYKQTTGTAGISNYQR